MVHSMTGFASGTGAADDVAWSIELRGVNAKGLDIRMRLPEAMQAQEAELRALISKQVLRGNITLALRVEQTDAASTLALDEAALEAYLNAAIKIRFKAKEKGLKLQPSRATDFLGMRGVVVAAEQTDQTLPFDNILKSLEETLTSFVTMRASEGASLAGVLGAQIDEIETLTAKARTLAMARLSQVAQALKDNLSRVLDNSDGADADRVAQELALLAVKADVQEEIDRLRAHIEAARALLAANGAIGRKLDFLMQEFNREANTLCSKSNDTELTRVGLDLKAVIDQMREQVQNVE